MTFSSGHTEACVWFWLPGAAEPVLCGRVVAQDTDVDAVHRFVYEPSYRELESAIPLVPHALPVQAGEQPTRRGLHAVLRDATPDAWGRLVLMQHLLMSRDEDPTEIDYLVAGGQGVGALHCQLEPDTYRPKPARPASLEQLMSAAALIEQGEPLPADLDEVLVHAVGVGGARPKALLNVNDSRPVIAKFSSPMATYSIIKLEALGLALARRAGIETVSSQLITAGNQDVLLVTRFDCEADTPQRRHFFSALTALELDETAARYGGYPDLADYLHRHAEDPIAQCRELYRRMLLNIMIGNIDDHARNHALFWDGRSVRLTPAYDICVLPRVTLEASQAMEVGDEGGRASLPNAFSQCGRFGLTKAEAQAMADSLEDAIRQNWRGCCESAGIPDQMAAQLWERTVLSPAIKQD